MREATRYGCLPSSLHALLRFLPPPAAVPHSNPHPPTPHRPRPCATYRCAYFSIATLSPLSLCSLCRPRGRCHEPSSRGCGRQPRLVKGSGASGFPLRGESQRCGGREGGVCVPPLSRNPRAARPSDPRPCAPPVSSFGLFLCAFADGDKRDVNGAAPFTAAARWDRGATHEEASSPFPRPRPPPPPLPAAVCTRACPSALRTPRLRYVTPCCTLPPPTPTPLKSSRFVCPASPVRRCRWSASVAAALKLCIERAQSSRHTDVVRGGGMGDGEGGGWGERRGAEEEGGPCRDATVFIAISLALTLFDLCFVWFVFAHVVSSSAHPPFFSFVFSLMCAVGRKRGEERGTVRRGGGAWRGSGEEGWPGGGREGGAASLRRLPAPLLPLGAPLLPLPPPPLSQASRTTSTTLHSPPCPPPSSLDSCTAPFFTSSSPRSRQTSSPFRLRFSVLSGFWVLFAS